MIERDVIFHAMSSADDVIKVDVMSWLNFMTVTEFEICYYFTNRAEALLIYRKCTILILRADIENPMFPMFYID